MKFLKGVGIVLIVLMLCINSVWVFDFILGNQRKAVVSTVGSDLSQADIRDNNFFTFKYFSNKNKNGIEALEIKINAYTDENKSFVYGYGLQLIEPSFKQVDITDRSGGLFQYRYNSYLKSTSTATSYYNTSNGVSYSATVQIDEKNLFMLDFGNEDIWYARFKGLVKYQELSPFLFAKAKYYESIDCMYFVRDIYDMCKTVTLPEGQYEDYFLLDVTKYFVFARQPDNAEAFSELKDDTYTLVQNFMSCKLELSDDGLSLANQSMFGRIGGLNG